MKTKSSLSILSAAMLLCASLPLDAAAKKDNKPAGPNPYLIAGVVAAGVGAVLYFTQDTKKNEPLPLPAASSKTKPKPQPAAAAKPGASAQPVDDGDAKRGAAALTVHDEREAVENLKLLHGNKFKALEEQLATLRSQVGMQGNALDLRVQKETELRELIADKEKQLKAAIAAQQGKVSSAPDKQQVKEEVTAALKDHKVASQQSVADLDKEIKQLKAQLEKGSNLHNAIFTADGRTHVMAHEVAVGSQLQSMRGDIAAATAAAARAESASSQVHKQQAAIPGLQDRATRQEKALEALVTRVNELAGNVAQLAHVQLASAAPAAPDTPRSTTPRNAGSGSPRGSVSAPAAALAAEGEKGPDIT